MKSKILIAYILSPVCYYIGHFSCVLCHRYDDYLLATSYQKFMQWSTDLEDWCGKDIIWKRV